MSAPAGSLTVRVNYYGAAKAACGTSSENFRIARATVALVLAQVAARHGKAVEPILDRCSFLLDGRAVHDRTALLPEGADLDVLPPFAGG